MSNPAHPRAVVLFSGGLDSLLTAELLRRAGVDAVLLRHCSVFFPLAEGGPAPDCPQVVREISEEMVALVANPRYGYGTNANPCLDCKQMMYRKAWEEAGRQGAQFIATGEVLGQRPMTQRRDAFRRMEKGAGVEGLVVRPLSGRLLPPTLAEQQGLIRREDMLDMQGRTRKPQMALAAAWGITNYPAPAGGCKLTDPNYGARALALRAMGLLSVATARAAHHGRFIRVGERSVALVGRSEADDGLLEAEAPEGSLLLELEEDLPGPLTCLIGERSPEAIAEARRLVVRHSRFRDLPPTAVVERFAGVPR